MLQFSLRERAPTILHPTLGSLLLLHPLSLRIGAASPHCLDDGSCSNFSPTSVLFSLCCLMAVLAPEVNHSSALPSMGHSHCLFFPVPGMPQTQLWKELESPLCCILIPWPQPLLYPVISGALIQGKMTFLSVMRRLLHCASKFCTTTPMSHWRGLR